MAEADDDTKRTLAVGLVQKGGYKPVLLQDR
jgi:hypothetical protein